MNEVVVYRKRRGIEAVMLALAVALGASGYLLTHLNIDGRLPDEWPWPIAILLGFAVVVHVFTRWRVPYADPLILPLVMLLNGVGLAMIHRLDLAQNPPQGAAGLQLIWMAAAVVAFCAVLFVLRDYRALHRYTYLLFLAGLILLLLPLIPGLGTAQNGARIWIHIGTYSLQPAEFAKIVLAIAFASYLVDKRDVLALAGWRVLGFDLPRARDLGPILIMWLASLAVLVFQNDLGTSLMFFGLFVVMLYVATQRPSWPILGTLLFAGGAYAAFLLVSHVRVRVSSWLDPFSNYDQNYQVIQAQFGFAYGGLLGTGWGLGRPDITPLARSDFISAAIGEELGVAGLTAVLLIYGLLVSRGLRAALGSSDPFGKLLAAGLSFGLAIQVITIVGGVTRLLPLTGLTTPFMSQGGSSLVANWIMVALLLVITHHARRPVAAAPASAVASLAAEETQVIAQPASATGGPAPEAAKPESAKPAPVLAPFPVPVAAFAPAPADVPEPPQHQGEAL